MPHDDDKDDDDDDDDDDDAGSSSACNFFGNLVGVLGIFFPKSHLVMSWRESYLITSGGLKIYEQLGEVSVPFLQWIFEQTCHLTPGHHCGHKWRC